DIYDNFIREMFSNLDIDPNFMIYQKIPTVRFSIPHMKPERLIYDEVEKFKRVSTTFYLPITDKVNDLEFIIDEVTFDLKTTKYGEVRYIDKFCKTCLW